MQKKINNLIIMFCLLSSNVTYSQTSLEIDTSSFRQNAYLYLYVDKLPTFKYENLSATKFIYKNLKWPSEFDGDGTVIVSFTILKNGDLKGLRIEKGLCPECDREVRRVFEIMPKWRPGKVKNKPVDVILYLPVRFKLN